MDFLKTLTNLKVDSLPPHRYNEYMSTKEMAKMTFRLPKPISKKLKLKIVQNSDTIQRICEEAIDQYLKK